jgi:hypothetical protein
MRRSALNFCFGFLLVAVALVMAAPAASAMPRDRDAYAKPAEMQRFDRFLNNHPAIAVELRRDPQLVNDPVWLAHHRALDRFLAKHPRVREELRENPRAFLDRDRRYDGRDRRYDRDDGRAPQ